MTKRNASEPGALSTGADPGCREQDVPNDEPFIRNLTRIIHFAVRALALLMTAVIVWGVVDVVYVLYERLLEPPFLLLNINDILATFGAFMAVLIAIEIFINITVYLREDVIHVKIVIATALMAIARKVIIMDLDQLSWQEVLAISAAVLALSIGYWLVVVKDPKGARDSRH